MPIGFFRVNRIKPLEDGPRWGGGGGAFPFMGVWVPPPPPPIASPSMRWLREGLLAAISMADMPGRVGVPCALLEGPP